MLKNRKQKKTKANATNSIRYRCEGLNLFRVKNTSSLTERIQFTFRFDHLVLVHSVFASNLLNFLARTTAYQWSWQLWQWHVTHVTCDIFHTHKIFKWFTTAYCRQLLLRQYILRLRLLLVVVLRLIREHQYISLPSNAKCLMFFKEIYFHFIC